MNFRPQHPKGFGNRGYDPPNPWITEEELFNMRRQTAQFHPSMQNMPSAMHSPYINQSTFNSPANKNFMNQNSCNMSNANFTYAPNPEIFKSSHSMNDSSFTNRMIGNRFPGGSYSQANIQHKVNEDLLFKDLPPPSNMSHQFPKNEGFSENSLKLFSNMRSPMERFSCMQKDQSQFNQKFDDSQIFQGKDFPFSNKEIPPQLPVTFIDKVPVSTASNFPPCKSNYKVASLFPAYTPKDNNNEIAFQKSQTTPDEITKNINQPAYSTDFSEKVSANFYDKASVSSKYSKPAEPFPRKNESFQERDISLNEVFPPQNSSQSYLNEKSHFKSMSNSPVPQDSLKALENSVSASNSKFPFSSVNQDTCFQTSTEIPFQTSQSMQLINHSSSSTSRDCLMQSVTFSSSGTSLHSVSESTTTISSQLSAHPSSKETFSPFGSTSQSNIVQNSSFNVTSGQTIHPSTKETFSSYTLSSQPNIQQNSKDSFSSFNFESSMNSTDISDLLPGLDAFLKEPCKSEETLTKSESVHLKSDLSKSSVSNCAFNDEDDVDDELSKHSIPFIGDTQISSNNALNVIKAAYCDETTIKDKSEHESEKPTELKLTAGNESNIGVTAKTTSQKDGTLDKDTSKTHSALEDAIELLVKCDAIVGLDYVVEYKKNLSMQGSFPFRCKLCNSSITRPSIIDHIIGSKHRMRYVKSKNESTYDYLVSLKLEKNEKDAKIAEAAFHMELLYGRGRVTVIDDYQPGEEVNVENKEKEVEDQTEEPVFTLDKIPIGFEALSPQHEEMDSSAFPLESDLDPKQDTSPDIIKETSTGLVTSEMMKEVASVSKIDPDLKLPGVGNETPSHYAAGDLQLEKISPEVSTKLCKPERDENDLQINAASCQVKRSLSPQPSSSKALKTDFTEESKPCVNMQVDEKSTVIKREESPSVESKTLMMDILEEFSKSEITSHEEANLVVKIVGMLVQMLLRYDLPHMSVENLESMLNSLQVSSSEKNVIEDIKSLLNGGKIHSEIKEERTEKMELSFQDASGANTEQKLPTTTENRSTEINLTLYEPNVSVPNVNAVNNSGSCLMLNTNVANVSSTISEIGTNTIAQTTVSAAVNAAEILKTASDTSVAFVPTSVNSQTENTTPLKPPPFPNQSVSSTVGNSQAMNAAELKYPNISEFNVSTATSSTHATANTAGLQPPAFFNWPQNNETNTVSYANVQNTQNMIWSNAYPYSQQYSQMSYYQPQNYGNHFSGTQSYQSQFPIMAQPPPPPPPPLPPSVPLPANPPPSVPFNQPPPPPLP